MWHGADGNSRLLSCVQSEASLGRRALPGIVITQTRPVPQILHPGTRAEGAVISVTIPILRTEGVRIHLWEGCTHSVSHYWFVSPGAVNTQPVGVHHEAWTRKIRLESGQCRMSPGSEDRCQRPLWRTTATPSPGAFHASLLLTPGGGEGLTPRGTGGGEGATSLESVARGGASATEIDGNWEALCPFVCFLSLGFLLDW